MGLAWTAVGGEIMYVEAAKMPGEGKLVLTGQLGKYLENFRRILKHVLLVSCALVCCFFTSTGDVMKESAQIGLNWLRSNASKVSPISYKVFCKVHLYSYEDTVHT